MRDRKIEIVTHPAFNLRRVTLGLALQMVPIAVGIWTGSAAMQWMGFVCSLIIMFAVAAMLVRRDQGLTIAEARVRLDEIEAEEAK